MRRVWALAVALGLVGGSGPAPSSAGEVCERPLVVGYENWAPFEFVGPEGPGGINVDLHRALSEITGCATRWREMPWPRVLRELRDGTVDVANTATATEKRRRYARFSAPYLDYKAVLFLRAGDDRHYDSLAAFLDDGNTLAVARGYSYGETADALIRDPAYEDQVTWRYRPASSVRGLAFGRVDGTIGNPYTMGAIARDDGIASRVRATGTVVQSDPVRVMFARASVPERVVAAYSEAIATLKARGTIREILRRYTGGRRE